MSDREPREPLTRRGARLGDLRREANLTQKELADVVGVSQVTISRIESGRQGMTEVMRVRVADALGLDVTEAWPPLTIEEVREIREARTVKYGMGSI